MRSVKLGAWCDRLATYLERLGRIPKAERDTEVRKKQREWRERI